MESVSSMDEDDQHIMSESFGSQPWRIDAGTMSWCSRPRLYWLSWDLVEQEGVTLLSDRSPAEVVLVAHQDLELACQEGWIKRDISRPFPTYTTSRPRSNPGRRPAGLHQCSEEEVRRWADDQYRFPPYQYTDRNTLVSRSGQVRLPSIEEKEFHMGFPVGYTSNCVNKTARGTTSHRDLRHSLIGNSWSVPVVAWLVGQLFGRLGLCPPYNPQELMDMLTPGGQVFLQARLWRAPLRPLRASQVIRTNWCTSLLISSVSKARTSS